MIKSKPKKKEKKNNRRTGLISILLLIALYGMTVTEAMEYCHMVHQFRVKTRNNQYCPCQYSEIQYAFPETESQLKQIKELFPKFIQIYENNKK